MVCPLGYIFRKFGFHLIPVDFTSTLHWFLLTFYSSREFVMQHVWSRISGKCSFYLIVKLKSVLALQKTDDSVCEWRWTTYFMSFQCYRHIIHSSLCPSVKWAQTWITGRENGPTSINTTFTLWRGESTSVVDLSPRALPLSRLCPGVSNESLIS